MNITYDPNYEEPKPERHEGIKCFTCNRILLRKSHALSHMGHDVDYLGKDGARQ